MSAPTVQSAPRRYPGAARALLVLLGLTGASSTVLLLGAAAGGPAFSDGADAGRPGIFLASTLLPIAVMGWLVTLAARSARGGVPVVVLGTVVLVILTLAVVLDFSTSRSPTALLTLFSLPDHQWSVVQATVVLVVGVHVLLRLRSARRSSAGEDT